MINDLEGMSSGIEENHEKPHAVLSPFTRNCLLRILWHADPLLGKDRQISNNATAVTK
jgi:hypothetical protein